MIQETSGMVVPWSEYPRMLLQRDAFLILNGLYEYQITDGCAPSEPLWNKIMVPYPLNTEQSLALEEVKENAIVWYRKTFTCNSLVKGYYILNFEAVNQCCDVFVNGIFVGSHEGGYAPFSFDISSFVEEEKDNTMLVKVYNFADRGNYAYGKQAFQQGGAYYSVQTGIYGTVWLESLPESALTDVKITPDVDDGNVYLSMAGSFEQAVITVFENKTLVHRGITNQKNYMIPLEHPHLYTCQDPFLYDVYIQTEDETIKTYFGMRKFSKAKDRHGIIRFALNDQPIYLNGILWSGYCKEGGYTYTSDQDLYNLLKKVKDLGYNMIRVQDKVESRRFYYHCDRLGILVMQDMVSGGKLPSNLNRKTSKVGLFTRKKSVEESVLRTGQESKENYFKELDGMLNAVYNNTSIIGYTLFHEGRGMFDPFTVLQHVKNYDDTRLVDVSNGFQDENLGDFQSEQCFEKKWKLPKPDGRILFLSEYGGLVYREELHADHRYVEEKGAYTLKPEYNEGLLYIMNNVIYPNIRKGLSGSVYTQLLDVEQECNGLITSDRQVVKPDEMKLKRINEKCLRSIR